MPKWFHIPKVILKNESVKAELAILKIPPLLMVDNQNKAEQNTVLPLLINFDGIDLNWLLKRESCCRKVKLPVYREKNHYFGKNHEGCFGEGLGVERCP